MADVNKNIKAAGGEDYTTISGFEAAVDVTSDRWIGHIVDTAEYDEEVTWSFTGTADATNYMKLTVDSGFRHAGIFGTGHARQISDTAGHANTVSESFCMFEYLQVFQSGTGSSDECYRINNADCLWSRMILRTNTTASQDCLYTASDVGWSIDNTVFLEPARAGMLAQAGAQINATINVDYCTCVECGTTNDGGFISADNANSDPTINVNNCAGFLVASPGSAVTVYNTSDGSGVTWAGTANIAGDTSAEANFTSSYDSVVLIETDPVSGENMHVTNKDSTFDLTIVDEDAETVTQNGTSRIGSEPDSRQDFSTDIAGNNRAGESTFSIGAFEFITAVVGGRIMSSLVGAGGLAGAGGIAGRGGGLVA